MRTSLILFATTVLTFGLEGSLAGQATAAMTGEVTRQAGQRSVGAAADSVRPLQRTVSLDLRDVSLNQALKAIDRQAELGLSYTPRVVPVTRRVTVRLERVTAREALERVLEGTGVRVMVTVDGAVMLVKEERNAKTSMARPVGVIYGQVTDTAGNQRVSGAQVMVQHADLTATTNDSGFYAIRDVPVGQQTVVVRLIGYRPLAQVVTVGDSQAVRLDFSLAPSPTRLAEVMTTATGNRRRLELGSDIVLIRADSIMATQPVTSVAELLEGRVPGLIMQRTTGAPGDPSRLRLRGASSVHLNNDPIVFVDGVRVYAAQSDSRNGNLANPRYAAPSPLDYIDPHTIETIEVMKGPSAATLYGSDAANGVIVITTKKGQIAPPRWTVTMEYGGSRMPGNYPDHYLRWGHRRWDRTPVICPITDQSCIADSLARFQMLSDPRLSVLGSGSRVGANVGVSGGSETVTYSVGVNYSDETGLLRLPQVEVDRYRALHAADPPDWMRRPQGFSRWGVSSRIGLKLGRRADVSFTARVSELNQRRSSLERELSTLMATYIDRGTGIGYRVSSSGLVEPIAEVFEGYYERAQARARQFTNGVSLTWRPLDWLTTSANVGISAAQREDESFQPRGAVLGDTSGQIAVARGSHLTGTANARATAVTSLPLELRLQAAVGINYTYQRTKDDRVMGADLPPGGNNIGQAGTIVDVAAFGQEQATFGWYIEPTISFRRLFLSTGLRFDGASTFGSQTTLATFPKLNFSYLISDEPFFPLKSVFSTLRLRAAYGQAGVQPGAGDRLRLYGAPAGTSVDGRSVNYVMLETLGNTGLKSERSEEFEGGFDADLLDDRLSLTVTGFHRTRFDALMRVPLPPSVHGGASVLRNVGTIRSTGAEASLTARMIRSEAVTFGATMSLAQYRNVVVSLGRGVEPFNTSASGRVAPGYPLFGRWARPVLGYYDRDADDILEASEVLYGDTLVYLGRSDPEYTAAFHPTLTLFRGALAISAGLLYEHGQTQWMSMLSQATLRASHDPTVPLGDQAAVVSASDSDFLRTQRVSTLRFNSLSISYALPAAWARLLGARAAAVSLQGTNLGLRTNYRGLDPNVNSTPVGNDTYDNGALPAPRTWQVRVSTSF